MRTIKDYLPSFIFFVLLLYTAVRQNTGPAKSKAAFSRLFYHAGLNSESRVQLSGNGPREDFAVFVEWVLVCYGLLLTVDVVDKDTSPTLDPETNPPSPRCTDSLHSLSPPQTNKPSPGKATELRIAPKPEPQSISDQVKELATLHTKVDEAGEREDAEESPTHCTTAEGELLMVGVSICFFFVLGSWFFMFGYSVWATHTVPKPLDCSELLPTFPLLHPHIITAASAFNSSAPLPLLPGSPSAHPPSVRWDHMSPPTCTDLDPVTPNLLLMGQPDSSLPQVTYPANELIGRCRWRQSQVLTDDFWSSFTRHYLPNLQLQHKWHAETKNLAVGSVVKLFDPQLP
ncbi:Protein PRRC2B [Labeo rohita]|uniref:Protein PRRC2B n=1 Tax=Labeo rohita TaxID=84645 RepID=A0ABQ8M572_LABRO|nr:Protein PRRC2B [Labeo rohita]